MFTLYKAREQLEVELQGKRQSLCRYVRRITVNLRLEQDKSVVIRVTSS